MSTSDTRQIIFILTVPHSLLADAERLVASHAAWVTGTHDREGEGALLGYSLVRGEELSNPMDLASPPTGNTLFAITETYATEAGVADHWRRSLSWDDFRPFLELVSKVKVTVMPSATVVSDI